MYKVILFDLDDTLYLERDYVLSGYKIISKYLEKIYKISSDELLKKMEELSKESYEKVFNRLLDFYKINSNRENIMYLIEMYKSHIPNIKLCEDSEFVIKELIKKNIKLGLITDGDAIQQRNKIKALGIEKYFEKIIITDELGSNREFWKPNKKSFELMIEFFKEDPKNMLYIGDNLNKDPFGALEVGINFKQISRKNTIKTYPKGEFYLGKNFKKILEIINNS